MAWLRLYDGILDDPKIQMLSDRAFRMLINLWCLAKRHGGTLPADLATLAFALRWPEGRVRDTLNILITAKLIDRVEDGYEPHDWNEHQYDSDSAAERMKRYRQRLKERNTLRNNDVPDTEADTETEPEKKDDDDARAKVLLPRICEILSINLHADPARITWHRSVTEMLRDGLTEAQIIAATEDARTRGIVNIKYIRSVAFSPPKPPPMAGPQRLNGGEMAGGLI